MNDPSTLFKVLAKYQSKNTDIKTPAKYAAENFDTIFNVNKQTHIKIINTAKTISAQSAHPQEDLSNFIQGTVLATPYNLNQYLKYVQEEANKKYTNISTAINFWLENQFRQNHPELFDKLNNIEYTNINTPFNIKSSRNPHEVKNTVSQTNSCLTSSSVDFLKDMTQDAGTLYLLAAERTAKNPVLLFPNAGFAILNAFQGKDKKETLLSVDTIWINNKNKELICSMLEALNDLSKYLDIPIIDKTMSINYLQKNGHKLDVYDQTQSLFKLGHVPVMMRYNHIHIPTINDGFYIINSATKCK